MDDLISRQAAIEAVNSRKTAEQCKAGKTRNWTVDICVDMIKQLPPIQPKRGKWIDTRGVTEWYAREYECSECGGTMLGEANFCPNCGAKMEVTA